MPAPSSTPSATITRDGRRPRQRRRRARPGDRPRPSRPARSSSSTGGRRAPTTSAAWSRRSALERPRRGACTADAASLPTSLPGRVDAVVARGFGPPAETLRAAAPLLVGGGLLVVSEPPRPTRGPLAGDADAAARSASSAIGAATTPRVACFRRVDVSRGTRGVSADPRSGAVPRETSASTAMVLDPSVPGAPGCASGPARSAVPDRKTRPR